MATYAIGILFKQTIQLRIVSKTQVISLLNNFIVMINGKRNSTPEV